MLARRPFIPSSVRVSRHTTENCVGQAGLNRLSKDLPGVKFDTNVIEDELKDLRQRASLLHAKQMLLRDPNNLELKQKVREMAQDLEGSTWATIRDLKMENASLKGRIRCASSQASTPRSPRAKQPESRAEAAGGAACWRAHALCERPVARAPRPAAEEARYIQP